MDEIDEADLLMVMQLAGLTEGDVTRDYVDRFSKDGPCVAFTTANPVRLGLALQLVALVSEATWTENLVTLVTRSRTLLTTSFRLTVAVPMKVKP